ncbi:hypothetical protein C3492_26880 [Streptomyces sp. Ru62]|uniref:hypothetical protein n=1 Tax=Streptomyces sp. Ru62 TaxID=2080745 RepID=UPI000CDDE7CD|nr:hypothetical protein [Streptomyces sp. Ru62]POX60383.1 hypothetical protein C3492_26880 [Streptomyces sp. Ru62]
MLANLQGRRRPPGTDPLTKYVLPPTGELRAALEACAQTYGRTAAVYATIGANQAAAAALAGTDLTPHRL